MSEIVLLGGTDTLYQSDALDNFSASAEGDVALTLRGRMHVAGGPAGERVFRRLHITVIHNSGCAFYATPIVDGVRLNDLRTFFSRSAPAALERYVFMLPLRRIHPDYPTVAMGLRGSAIEIEIEAVDPTARWHLESVSFSFHPVNQARGKRADE